MKPRKLSPAFAIHSKWTLLTFIGVLTLSAFLIDSRSSAQGQIQVTAANPASGAQGTLNLNVKVTGKGFKNGAKAKWLVSGSSDTGGVTVNSTTFVSSTEVTANITVAETATIANFDIQVTNSDGRGGKGTELFAVTPKGGGNALCPPMQPAPASDSRCYGNFPGCLDSTFGGTGFVIKEMGQPNQVSWVRSLAIQPDGKIVAAVQVPDVNGLSDFGVFRFNDDGALDTSFGDPDPANAPLRLGYVVTAVTPDPDIPNSIAIQADGKIVVSGGLDDVVRYNTNGTLDTAFGIGGIAHLTGVSLSDMAIQSDGKIVLAGLSGDRWSIVRLNTNGSLDVAFGSAGYAEANPSGTKRGSSGVRGLAIQRIPAVTGEERIVVVGSSRPTSNGPFEWTLMRFRSTGAADTTFGTSGIVKTPFAGFGSGAGRVRIDSSNRIVVAGTATPYNPSCGGYVGDFAVARYNENGTLDGSFGGGTQFIDIYGGGDGNAWGLNIQPDGKILISGDATSSDNTVGHFALVRLNPDGSRDTAFGILGNGVTTLSPYGYRSRAWGGVVLQPDGKIVLGGSTLLAPGAEGDMIVARYWP
jgi:uncharacterized delta-60 repeat protein